ncbi:hypothetical protein HRbin17_02043 [bacterium HR17]|uniref:Cupin type-1 domain-containing protein n=1 Tax=Candidatus Fervidibacter japonicus TaxID=2035412 RepID=A0A2H5XEA3_9BACT|nr:hypothetical protein HRbin17_02043 [bacterium HR17]
MRRAQTVAVSAALCVGIVAGAVLSQRSAPSNDAARVWLALPSQTTLATGTEIAARLQVPDGQGIARSLLGQTEHATLMAVAVRTQELPHRHAKSDLLVIVLRGQGKMTVGDRTETVRVGDIVFVPKGVPHFFTNTDRAPSVALVLFTPPFQPGDTVPVNDKGK